MCLDLARSIKAVPESQPRQNSASRHVDVFQHRSTDRVRILIIFAHPDKSGSLNSPAMTYDCLRGETLDDSARAHQGARGNRKSDIAGSEMEWVRSSPITIHWHKVCPWEAARTFSCRQGYQAT